MEFGKKAAWTAFAAVSLISLIIGIDKEAAFFYLFIGHYPLIKWEIERIGIKVHRLIAKLAVFNICFAVMYLFLGFVLGMDAVIAEFSEMNALMMVVFIVMLNLCLLLYDRLVFPLMILYDRKIRPKLRFIRH